MKNLKINLFLFTITFVLFFNLNFLFCQNHSDSIVYAYGREGYRKYLVDRLTFYNDSTFKYQRQFSDITDSTSGFYTSTNGELILTSFDCYKKPISVIEKIDTNSNRIYMPFFSIYLSLIEIFKSTKQSNDTLFFYTWDETNTIKEYLKYRESNNNDVIGFKLYYDNQYVGDYYFKDKNSNIIIFDFDYYANNSYFYLDKFRIKYKDEKTILVNEFTYIKEFIRIK